MSKAPNEQQRYHAQVISAYLLLLSGIGLSFLGFFTPPVGEISDSVLLFMSQALIYAGSVFGLKAYVDRALYAKNE